MSLLLSDAEAQSSGIKVYDANDKFLGFYVAGTSKWQIFLPAQKTILDITLKGGDLGSQNVIGFESTDCTGTGYANSHYINRVSDGAGGFRYYKHVYELVTYTQRSWIHPTTGACQPGDNGEKSGFAAVEISEADIPALPVALPLRLE